MSWSIGLIENSVKVSKKVAKELYIASHGDFPWTAIDTVAYKGKLVFDPDHMEGMDYLSQCPELVEVLKKNKVYGKISFGSLDGDNAGDFWGYEFDGLGGMHKLTGTIVWKKDKK